MSAVCNRQIRIRETRKSKAQDTWWIRVLSSEKKIAGVPRKNIRKYTAVVSILISNDPMKKKSSLDFMLSNMNDCRLRRKLKKYILELTNLSGDEY